MREGSGLKAAGLRLFGLSLPLLLVVFLFSYLPLYGWIYAFYDYHAGMKLSDTEFVGFRHFTELIDNPVIANEIVRVLRNTFAMSLLGIATSPLPALFAIFLLEVRSRTFRKLVQTLTTLPNFISWILVYAVAWSVFSVGDGFLNRLLLELGWIETEINFLASSDHVWLTMLGYSLWKGLGWGAIIFLAAIASIDHEQYEAATVDGAGRFQKMRHVTIPGILPTFFVLLLLSIANFINSGMEQYFIFQNPLNKDKIEVLDLYVYNQGMVGQSISYATVVSMLKSLVSVALLFVANTLSKAVRKESII
ncbi:ABC transporter permease [Cohnella sp. CIP 111063]|uniref:ABC transporter permease n=1 Tax=unclassified Cohnella TaxID=2636738 RepID=UPI000B8C3B7D|nr:MULTISPECIES: ABC transporter permease subunit [unclassified Cohnella]OXS59857.1 ABC transporter permease [Cohnella sp. CIP 111063]PRX72655.1 carbohydrate ABC transporter membrane protein 1 (CUT1 family) [Cohnella sp. SGD-V74]